MRSRSGFCGMALLAASLPLAGCAFYSTVSATGDLGIDNVRVPPILLSKAQAPDEASKSLPVVITVHGFGATNYETQYAADFLKARGFLVSLPNMGGHGEASLEQFASATWLDWGRPIAEEYNALKALGYRDVQFLTVSTGGPVVMELLSRKQFQVAEPKRISMVAPILDSYDKLLGGVGLLQFLGARGRPTKKTGTNVGKFYSDWPASSLRQLVDLTEVMKGRLRTGITVSDDTRIQIFQSDGDTTVDPVSADLWASGIKGGLVAVYRLNSSKHVPIGMENIDNGKSDFTPQDLALRDRILAQIAAAHKQ